MAATAWMKMSFSFCIVYGFDSYTVLFKCPQRKFFHPTSPRGESFSGNTWKLRYTNHIRTRYRNWTTTSATQLQPSKSLCYIGYTSIWRQHDCLTVQTLHAIYTLTPETRTKRKVVYFFVAHLY